MLNLIRRNKNAELAARETERWDPFRLMEEMVGWDPFREVLGVQPRASFVPAFEVKETGDSYMFKADLPGVKEQDLEISLTGNRLTISGKRESEKTEDSDRFYAFERSYGSFSRSFTLPEGGDPEDVTADLKGGVLTLVVNKKPEVQPRKIQIGTKTKA